MIYEFPDASAAIRQGDIFESLPQVQISLAQLFLVGEEDGTTETRRWEDVLTEEFVRLVVTARPVTGIVITQDCDTQRADLITLCAVQPMKDIVVEPTPRPEKFFDQLRTQCQKNLKWFYLPPDPRIGFADRMAVDFQVTFTVPRADLEALRRLRRGRLIHEADEHFRERLSDFFRRYPVDEWYPLSREEFVAYQAKVAKDATPRPWQLPAAAVAAG